MYCGCGEAYEEVRYTPRHISALGVHHSESFDLHTGLAFVVFGK